MRIDFFIIGAQKAGTTSLHSYLSNHNEIFMPEFKEINFFANDSAFDKGPDTLQSHYNSRTDEKLCGLSHVQILYFPAAAARVFEHNPNAKIVAILRNPVDRAYSAYWYARRNGVERCESFELALSRDRELGDDYFEQADFSYLRHGNYVEQLRRFSDLFPAEQLRIVLTEDMAHRNAFWPDFLSWLGVNTDLEHLRLNERHNTSAMPRNALLQRVIKSSDSWLKRAYRQIVPLSARRLIMKNITDPLIRRNLTAFEYPPMQDDTRARLISHFEPMNSELASYLNRNLDHWNR